MLCGHQHVREAEKDAARNRIYSDVVMGREEGEEGRALVLDNNWDGLKV